MGRSAQNWLEAHRVRSALAPATGYYSVSTADLISVTPASTYMPSMSPPGRTGPK